MRKLQVGDFLWLARERTVPTPGTTVFVGLRWQINTALYALTCIHCCLHLVCLLVGCLFTAVYT